MSTENKDFNQFGLPPELVETLTKLGFAAPTPIQAQGIPVVMEGKDLMALAPTGTGKTGAFGIPAMANLMKQSEKQVLVLAPTRELANQILKFLASLVPGGKVRGALLVGGESIRRQYMDWNEGVDFIVATPGRLMDHVGRGLDLKHIGILILDEVDRMLDMGFAPQIEEIVKMVSKERQTLFFSATLPPEIQKLAQRYLKDPVRVTVGGKKEDAPKIREQQIPAKGYQKIELLGKTVKEHPGKILVFTRTQIFTDKVAEQLEYMGIEAARLHGGRTQSERTRALDAFRRGRVRVLVATDIAARGIDVPDIEVVVNFDRAATKEDHTHRIGRTGRFGKEGLAITFVDGGFSRGPSRGFSRGGNREDRPSGPQRSRPFQPRGAGGGGYGQNRGREAVGGAPARAEAPRAQSPKDRDSQAEALRVQSSKDRNAQAEADSDPRNFGKRKIITPGQKSGKTYRRREAHDGVSGSVRYFRNKETQPVTGKRKPISAPVEMKPAKPFPGLPRGQKGAVRRPSPSQPSI